MLPFVFGYDHCVPCISKILCSNLLQSLLYLSNLKSLVALYRNTCGVAVFYFQLCILPLLCLLNYLC
ncbi:hypothetical protein RIF29_42229 [Crotalaria pallida]|uniref:Uncharacterized protein n=1 Tax=Crotalaria pallida TaxID=3830 RepID=A0AAN9E6K0_CROPI